MYIYASGVGAALRRRTPHVDSSSSPLYLRAALLFVFALAINLAAPLAAHAQATDGVITGSATDPQGAALANVAVTARNIETGTSRTVQSGSNGEYRLTALPAGTYDLSFSLEGFATSKVSNITLTVGLEFQHNVTLTAGGVQETVSVTAQQPLVDTTSSEAGTAVISETQINSLPISGRQATQLSLLLPGTGSDSTRQQRPDANVGAGDANVADTNYLVDGLTNMISGAGDPRDNIQEASIREFKVILTQTPAEYGGRSGGVVSLVTKSGTNNIHGEAFEFFRDHYINRSDYYTQNLNNTNPNIYPIPPFSRNQFGGAIGGPILKDRLHYFASFERLDDQEYFTVAPGGTGTTVAQQAVQKDYASLAGSFRTGSQLNSYFGRLDWQINPSHTAFLRFFEQNPNLYYCNGCNGNTAAFSTGDGGVQGWTWAAGETWVVSPRIVNQFAAQIAQSYQTSLAPKYETPAQSVLTASQIPASSLPPGVVPLPGGSTVYKFPSISWGFYPGTQFHAFYQELFDSLTVTHGQHTFKFGGDILNQPRNTQAAAQPLGTWTFKNDVYFNPNDPNFRWDTLKAAVPIRFTASYPTIPYQNENLESAVYAQDEWKVRPNLTLSLGLRYDLQTKVWNNHLTAALYPLPLPYVTFGGHGVHDNFAPRIGFAWDPNNDGKTVVRAGYGIVYTMNSNNIYGGQVSTLRQSSIVVSVPAGIASFPDPYNGLGYEKYVSTAPPNISINNNRVSNPPASRSTSMPSIRRSPRSRSRRT
jgi:outer membrane receptor protein involved in Fe transport